MISTTKNGGLSYILYHIEDTWDELDGANWWKHALVVITTKLSRQDKTRHSMVIKFLNDLNKSYAVIRSKIIY